MKKKTLKDMDVQGKRVLVRVDFNVPVQDGRVADDTRIQAALPTLRHVLDRDGSLILMSHLGRPKGGPDPKFSLRPVAGRLSELLDTPVAFATDCLGPEAESAAAALKPGEVLLLENTRFHPEEEGKVKLPDDASEEAVKEAKAQMKEKQEAMARGLASLGDVFVNDAFGTAHRAHASTAVITRFCAENAAGFLLSREIEYLAGTLADPARPFVAILGGAKVSDKVNVINRLLDSVDALIIGGAMAYTFLRARGLPTGESLVEEDKTDLAARLLKKAEKSGIKLLLPVDHVIADAFSAEANTDVVGVDGIRDGWMALDIGPDSAKLFAETVASAKTVVWNGPMGCFEMEPFAAGTLAVARALADSGAVSIVGGGDSVRAVNQSGLAECMTHISTGGGASLELLEGKALPGVEALDDA